MFFIFNLLFATWLILKIEKLRPSDFGKYRSIFEKTTPIPKNVAPYDKYYIKKLAQDYKSGLLDSVTFDLSLGKFIEDTKKIQALQQENDQ